MLLVSAVASFTVASVVLHPPLREHIPVTPLLEHLGVGAYAPVVPAAPLGEYVQTRFADCPQFFPQARPPEVPAGPALRELCYDAFAILHNGRSKTPVFVAQRLNRQMLQRARNVSRNDRFFEEARLPVRERAALDDYRNSGYSRGHMAPAGDMHTEAAMAQSFSLANMVPQDQRHNSGAWNKIENDTRNYVMRAKGDVYVFSGPVHIAAGATIGAGRVAKPGYLYKLVYDSTTGRAWAHWQANSPATEAGLPISYEDFVKRTGLRLLPGR
ncbi:MAG: DNA/RNA non-specific endonuclease [Burkholderiaceae bacterium]